MSGMSVMFLTMVVLLAIGVPIGVSLALGMLALLAVNPIMPMEFMAQSLYTGVASLYADRHSVLHDGRFYHGSGWPVQTAG